MWATALQVTTSALQAQSHTARLLRLPRAFQHGLVAAALQVAHGATRAQRHIACILQLPGAGMHIAAFSSQQQYLKLSRGQHVALEAADRSPSAQQHHTASDAPPGMEDRAGDSNRTSDNDSGQGGDAGQPGGHNPQHPPPPPPPAVSAL